ncbi:2-oxoacid:ferredoxin oxidoreductase subunit beta [Holophaga foetida]|uniref:2-oxoacid:ferredoxin oxidoreductase subunit beta n=1 Tax=Holophaga foetida TaxID=35839 RepID=UPI000247337F|nr:2-oxoacid:ferredoxin oxidoreductase subunit beta [Holophaga foetida]
MSTSPTTNKLGLSLQDYTGGKSTLCVGCGHEGITLQIIHAAFELGLEPHQVAKLSGIGCSSKTPAYFLRSAWGFNSIHGRAAAVCTGVALANRSMKNLLVSGDGDSMSIGLNHFTHLIRRNVPVVYIIEDNGVYALTKGQFSATADQGSALRWGQVNELPPVDPCTLAMELGCGFVARSFSGNPKQLKTLIKAAFAHPGTAVLDVISPCVTWNNHETSTRSYQSAKQREIPLQELGFIPPFHTEPVEIPAGESREVTFPDGSRITFRTLHEDYDPSNRIEAWRIVHESREKGELLTGLLYCHPDKPTLHDFVKTTQTPLTALPQSTLKPGPEVLLRIMEELA